MNTFMKKKSFISICFLLILVFFFTPDCFLLSEENKPDLFPKENNMDFNYLLKKFPSPSFHETVFPLCKSDQIDGITFEKQESEVTIKEIKRLTRNSSFIFILEINKAQLVYVIIKVEDSCKLAFENLIKSALSLRDNYTRHIDIDKDLFSSNDASKEYYCIYSPQRFLCFIRRNIVVSIKGDISLNIMTAISEHIDNYLQEMLKGNYQISNKSTAKGIHRETRKERQHSFCGRRKSTTYEELEQKIKSLPEDTAKKVCLEKGLKLSEMPDKNAKELQFYIRGLPLMEEDGTIKVLHRICDNAKDEQLLTATMRLQGKWLALFADQRSIVINDLSRKLKTDNRDLRKQAIASLGRAGSLDALSILLREWETRPDDYDILKAIGKILGWPQEDTAWDEARLTRLKMTISAFLQALDKLRDGNASAHDKLE